MNFKIDKSILEKIRIDRKKINKVLPFVLCILIAFLVWIYVMYVNEPEYVHEFDEIPVYTRDVPARFRDCEIIVDETVAASFRGTNVDLAKCENSGITGYVSVTRFSEPGSYDVDVTFEYPVGIELTPLESVRVRVEIKEPKMFTRYFSQIPIELTDSVNGSKLFLEYNITAQTDVIDAAITSQYESLLTCPQDSVKAVADIGSLAISGTGEYPVKLKFVGKGVEVFDDAGIYISILVSAKDSKTD